MENAVPLEEIAADIDALVASDAAKRLEQLIAGQLLRRDRGGVARKPAVEPAARRDQRALVGRDRIQEGGDVGLPPVRVAELPHRFGVGAQLADDLVRTRRHNRGIAKRLFGVASSSERKLPSQFRRKFRPALKTVGVLSASGRPSGVTSWALALAPFVRISWHDEQLCVSS